MCGLSYSSDQFVSFLTIVYYISLKLLILNNLFNLLKLKQLSNVYLFFLICCCLNIYFDIILLIPFLKITLSY